MKRAILAVLCVAFLSSQSLGQIGDFFPRLGWLNIDTVLGDDVFIALADSDEGLLISPIPDGFFGPLSILDPYYGDIGGPSSDAINRLTEAPNQFDNNDYALAVGLLQRDPNSPSLYSMVGFFQLRRAGSSATALSNVAGTPNDPTNPLSSEDDLIVFLHGGLAAMATRHGLWTHPDDYIEFPRPSAFTYPTKSPPTGPQDWRFSAFPEPGSAVLLFCGLLGAALKSRHR